MKIRNHDLHEIAVPADAAAGGPARRSSGRRRRRANRPLSGAGSRQLYKKDDLGMPDFGVEKHQVSYQNVSEAHAHVHR